VHCDWGSSPNKRWLAKALLQSDSDYQISAPEHVGDLGSLLPAIHKQAGKDSYSLVGFDFPIGLPAYYAKKARIRSFKGFLRIAGHGKWGAFYDVAEERTEISVRRPFYPFRPGGTKQRYLLEAHGAASMDRLRRRCELKQSDRKPACPVFWTLGAQQVGKGAIVGWRDVIAPAIRSNSTFLWPFDGPLQKLFRRGRTVVAETYPAEYYRRLCPSLLKGSKLHQDDRRKGGKELLRWVKDTPIEISSELRTSITNGFPQGDDAFDAIVGLLGMIEVVLGQREPGDPEEVRKVEGWILGQSPDEGEPTSGREIKEARSTE